MTPGIIHTELDGQTIKLSNLDKILFPGISVTKAEFIQYYLKIAPILLNYITDRPLTLIRFPDGIQGKRFYSKEKPSWTPDWIKTFTVKHQEKDIHYLVVDDKASLVWLANLASIEIHPMQFTTLSEYRPDYFVFDLDPDESVDFEAVKDCAFLLNDFLKGYDYTPFVKTSGGKGLHLIIPIKAIYEFDTLVNSVKNLAKLFISQYPDVYTLEINKEKRKGKILIDIYRNHLSNTTVAPYSVRGKTGAPISMPLYWRDLEIIKTPQDFTILNYQKYLNKNGDPWRDWRSFETTLHDHNKSVTTTSDVRLKSYTEKRNFNNTPEPLGQFDKSGKNHYVIQLHDARNLHYDLRLEDNGVLLSWAIPKGLPFKKGIKRLAIRTEDHPVKYLNFEGIIPKGQYGAGKMWIFKKGKFNWQEKSSNQFKFSLDEGNTYKLYKTKGDHWLIEYTGGNQPSFNELKISHMLADTASVIPTSKSFQYEVKWDGIRVLIFVNEEKINIVSRGGRNITNHFPEIVSSLDIEAESAVLDAEIVVLDSIGRPLFSDVISRMHTTGKLAIQKAIKNKRSTCYTFDLLYMDGELITDQALYKRREWLDTVIKWNDNFRFSKSFKDGKALFQAIKDKGMEGIMAKRKNSKYNPGQRSVNWIKIKVRRKDIAYIIGYTKGKGDRSALFGALHLAKLVDGGWHYMGKVGTGFDIKNIKKILKKLNHLNRSIKLIKEKIEEEHNSIWIEPTIQCELQYASLSSNRTYREPVFLNLVDDKSETLE